MKVYSLILIIFFSNCYYPQIKLVFKGDSLSAYDYNGGDEFEGIELKDELWKNGLEGRRVIMPQDLAFNPQNVIIEKGLVRFLAKKQDSLYTLYDWEMDSSFLKKSHLSLYKNQFQTHYSAGSILSKKKFGYGYYEIRFKTEEGKGIWPAFWFYGGKQNEEIDVFELKCEKNKYMHLDTHCPYGCDRGYKNKLGFNTNWGDWMPVSNPVHEGFNIMALDWRKNELFWYLNGYPVAYFKGDFQNPMNLYLNTSVAKDGDAFSPGPDATTIWPNHYYVDYLRIWKQQNPDSVLKLTVNNEFEMSQEFNSCYSNHPTKKRGLLYKRKKLNPLNGNITMSLNARNQLLILVLGEIKEKELTLEIISDKESKAWTDFEREIICQLAEGTKHIQLKIGLDNRIYSKKILLHN